MRLFGGKKNQPVRSLDDACNWLRSHGFSLTTGSGGTVLNKNGCTAAIASTANGGAKLTAYPCYLVGGEPADLVNKGYQQFFVTSTLTVPATADVLRALHTFSEEVKQALAMESLYNESLGTVSSSYHYDRVSGRG